MKLLFDNVLIKREEPEEKSAGGIIMPADATEKSLYGVVKHVGTGKIQKDGSLSPMSVKVGDRVLFDKYGPTELKIEGENLWLMTEDRIIAVVS